MLKERTMAEIQNKNNSKLEEASLILWMLTGIMILGSGIYGVVKFSEEDYRIISALYIVCGIVISLYAFYGFKVVRRNRKTLQEIVPNVPDTPMPPSKAEIAEANYHKFCAAYNDIEVRNMTDDILRRYKGIAYNATSEAIDEMIRRDLD